MSGILNWRKWNSLITLSGQPTEAQLADLKAQGVTHVINLGPHENDGALQDEAGTLAELDVEYIYIPVDFEAPTDEDFDAFCEALSRLEGRRIHVHCIYNARVTAFFFRYVKDVQGGSVEAAFELMDGIWRPGGVWADFIGDAASAGRKNQYAGYEY